MQKYLFTLVLILSFCASQSQPNTEAYLMDLQFSNDSFNVSNFINISNNEGYDSQPSFYSNNLILYARTKESSTDIALYNISEKSTKWLNNSTSGGEYSPKRIPESNNVSAVRLDTTGLQRLYEYDIEKKSSSLILENIQVAYYSYYDSNTILSSVLSGDKLDLVISNISEKKNDTLVLNSGRAIQIVPNTPETMSYTTLNDDGNFDVFQLEMNSIESFFVAELPIGVQDIIWLDESKLLIGSLDKLFLLDLFENGDWKQVADFSEFNIKDITRLALSPNGKKLTIIAELKD